MTTAQATTRYCGAKTRKGGACERPKGWGTPHPGSGRCKLHGGSHRNGRKAAATEAAMIFARGALGANIVIDPLDAQLLSVHLSYGAVEYWRQRLHAEGEHLSESTITGYEAALANFNRFSKNAVDAGIAERLVNIAERYGEQVALVCEAGIAAAIREGAALTIAQRRAFALAVEAAIKAREDDRHALPSGVGSQA